MPEISIKRYFNDIMNQIVSHEILQEPKKLLYELQLLSQKLQRKKTVVLNYSEGEIKSSLTKTTPRNITTLHKRIPMKFYDFPKMSRISTDCDKLSLFDRVD